MPSPSPPWTPDMDARAVLFFARLQREKYPHGIDAEGIVRWSSEWRMHVANGVSDEDAFQLISIAIDTIRAGGQPRQTRPGPYDVQWLPQMGLECVPYIDALEKAYREEHPQAPQRVDALGYVRWSSDYRVARANGYDAAGATRKVLNDIRRIWGVPLDVPPTPALQRPLVGTVQLIDGGRKGVRDANGPVLVQGIHGGDLLSRAHNHGWDFVLAQLDWFVGLGAQFVRGWTVLPDGWWRARTGELHPGKPGFWETQQRWARELVARGLRWQVSQGDMMRYYPRQHERTQFMRMLAELCRDEGGTDRLVLSLDAGNESWNGNGESPDANADSVARMREVIDAFTSVLPVPIRVLTSVHDEGVLNEYAAPPTTTVTAVHQSRLVFRNAMERAFTQSYASHANAEQRKVHDFTLADEPAGVNNSDVPDSVGSHVSATQRPSDWRDPEAMGNNALVHLYTRSIYTAMSSPGVISDEPFSNYPALALAPKVAAMLPNDIQSWDEFHGGEDRGFSPDRIVAVERNAHNYRCDHARAMDGTNRYGVHIYTDEPTNLSLRVVNDFEGEMVQLHGDLERTPVRIQRGGTLSFRNNRGVFLLGKRTS
jgi:hypothetical protein